MKLFDSAFGIHINEDNCLVFKHNGYVYTTSYVVFAELHNSQVTGYGITVKTMNSVYILTGISEEEYYNILHDFGLCRVWSA